MKKYKANVICVYNILKEYSDSKNIMPMGKIIEKLKTLYDLDLDRRTVYSAIDTLNAFGYEISDYQDNGVGYYLVDRAFELSEIRLLMDAVYSSPVITENDTQEIIDKLQKQLSINERKAYKSLKVVKGERKTANHQVFLNIEILDEAIVEGNKVSFVYMAYDFDKKLKPRREKRYERDPYGLVGSRGMYYLLCKSPKYNNMETYRIDYMKDIVIEDKPVNTKCTSAELDNASHRMVNSWIGEPERIVIDCDNRVLDYVIETFGRESVITRLDQDRFRVTVRMAPKGVVIWAMQFADLVEVVEPVYIREEIVHRLKKNRYGI